jgi:Raf kinase inhibitor-like YbhB/YbcL family protein
MRPARLLLSAGALALAVGACDTNDGRQLADPEFGLPVTAPPETTVAPETVPPPPQPPFQLVAPWQDGAPVPERHSCDGEDVAPALTWVNVPADTLELAITVTDPDAGGFVHWIVYGIDPSRTGVWEGELPPEALVWRNSFGNQQWNGPCPPPGPAHQYRFTVYALNQQLEVADDASAAEVISVLDLIAIGRASVTGTYERAS